VLDISALQTTRTPDCHLLVYSQTYYSSRLARPNDRIINDVQRNSSSSVHFIYAIAMLCNSVPDT